MLIPSDIKLYLYTEVTDMRKSIDGLCILVVDALNMHPASGSLFLFRNRRGDKLKALDYGKRPGNYTQQTVLDEVVSFSATGRLCGFT